MSSIVLDLHDALRRQVEVSGDLCDGWLAALVRSGPSFVRGDLVDDIDDVHRNADGAGLVGYGTDERMADPPRGVGPELQVLGVVEPVDRTDQPEVALLDQVQEEHAAAGVTLGERDDKRQVGLDQVVLGALSVLADPPQLALELHADLAESVELLLGEQPGLYALG